MHYQELKILEDYLQKGFDKFGNYTFGIKEHIIFPEVSFDRADKVRGLDIIIVIVQKIKNIVLLY